MFKRLEVDEYYSYWFKLHAKFDAWRAERKGLTTHISNGNWFNQGVRFWLHVTD